ncbi:hypothetical protein, partial [Mycobacterium avium]|uniref:hypothetical protein n=1 Tax=Mycobacterium avium TaxID=1764 RepID=UPI00191C7EA7
PRHSSPRPCGVARRRRPAGRAARAPGGAAGAALWGSGSWRWALGLALALPPEPFPIPGGPMT